MFINNKILLNALSIQNIYGANGIMTGTTLNAKRSPRPFAELNRIYRQNARFLGARTIKSH